LGHKPDLEFEITHNDRTTLQMWLAARYHRSVFPDAFDARLEGTKLRERIAAILKPRGEWIVAILLDVDDGKEIIRVDPDDPYVVRISVLYAVDNDPEMAETEATKAVGDIEKAFQDKCYSTSSGTWQNFELVTCEAISEAALSVRDSRLLKKLHTDHLSLRADPPQPVLEDGR
jgi:hypothetical protein